MFGFGSKFELEDENGERKVVHKRCNYKNVNQNLKWNQAPMWPFA